jgi:lipid-binding SYLF domain-containing protein
MWCAVAVLVTVFFLAPGARAGSGEVGKVQSAIAVMNEIMAIPETSIPPSLLEGAYGIAIFPDLLKAGFIVGARYGVGVMTVRRAEDRSWSNPVFFRLMGGSLGWQIGAQSSDIILVFRSIRSLDAITGGKFTLGVDASVAAGPVGRHAEAATDIQLKAEILSYSRSRGLFAGVALEGAAMQVDFDATSAFYEMAGLLPMQIFTSRNLNAPPVADELKRTMKYYAK